LAVLVTSPDHLTHLLRAAIHRRPDAPNLRADLAVCSRTNVSDQILWWIGGQNIESRFAISF
jgi:hypothetical protein